MKRRDMLLVLVGLLAGLLLVAAIWRFNAPAPVLLPTTDLPLGGRGPVGVRFSRPMQQETLTGRLTLDGHPPARVRWENDRTVWAFPAGGFAQGEHRLELAAGSVSRSGLIQPARVWSFQVRPAWIVYLSPAGAESDLWRADPSGELVDRLTDTGLVLDFSVSPDGQQIVYSASNELGGSDLGLIERDGGGLRELVRCYTDRCSAPAWSPWGNQIAYALLRKRALPGETQGAPRPMLVNVPRGNTSELSNDPLAAASQFAWSPDGSRLAMYDPHARAIRVRGLEDGVELLLQSNTGLGEWSPDGRRLLFTHEDMSAGYAAMRVYLADFSAGSTTLLPLDEDQGADPSLPRWSPDGEWLVYGRMQQAGNPSKQVWLARPDGSEARALTDDLSRTHTAYQWSPDGTRLLLQRFALGSSQSRPEIMVWDIASAVGRVVASDAAAAQWLP